MVSKESPTKADVAWWEREVEVLIDMRNRDRTQIRALTAEVDKWRSVAEVAGRLLRDTTARPKTDDEASILEWASRLGGPRPSQRDPVVVQQPMLEALDA